MQDSGSGPALRAERHGKRYGQVWGLRDCTFAVPAGSIVGLVGPNGAGKTTLLAMTVGLLAPTEGSVAVLGSPSQAQTPDTLARVSYLAQDHPLYRGFTVAEMFRFGRSLNPSWDQALAESRMDTLGIPLTRKVKALSGGQQAQVALTLALARRPKLLVLDEPVAMLDPVARHDFMAMVLTAAAADGVSVVLSSHVLTELERVADYLILMSRGRVQVAGEVDDLLACHRMLTGPAAEADRYTERPVVQASRAAAQAHLLVRATADDPVPAGWEVHQVGLEELVLAYLRQPGAGALPGPARSRSSQPSEVTG